MLDADLTDPPADPDAFKRWRDKETAKIEIAKSKLAGRPVSYSGSLILLVLVALLIVALAYLAFALRDSVDRIDGRTAKIESALSGAPPDRALAKTPDTKPLKTEAAGASDEPLARALNDIKDQVAATRTQVDAIRASIADLEKFASKAKDAAPAGFASDEMLVAQKGLVLKSAAAGGAGGTRTWLATPSHDMLDLLLKIPARTGRQSLTFTPKHDNPVKSIDIYDRNNKGGAGKIADCRADNKIMRCRLNVLGPTVLQVIVKTRGDDQLDVELDPSA